MNANLQLPLTNRKFIFGSVNISVEHIAIPAANPTALKDWYERMLAAKVLWSSGQTPPTYLISLQNVWFEIYQAEASFPQCGNNKVAGFRHLALKVESLAAAKMELETKGVQFTGEVRPAAGGGQVLFFEDLEGNLLHFVERPSDFKLG